MNDTALAPDFTPSPPPNTAWRPAPAPVPVPASIEPDVYETSPWLARITEGDTLLASARRTGVGLALTLPFAVAAGLRTEAGAADALLAGLGIPVGLALIALVGVAASTLGVSLASAPLSPADAASIASRGLFKAGILLAGLSPVTALWVAGGRWAEAALASTLVIAVAGVSGIGTIARGLVVATADREGRWHAGALGVALLFCGFAFVVGLRVWFHGAEALLASVHP